MTIGERPNNKNIETLNLTQKVRFLRLWCGKTFFPHLTLIINSKKIVYLTLAIDKLELRFLDQMSSIQIGLKRLFTPK